MKEQVVVNMMEQAFKRARRYYVNVHGSKFSTNGTPDFITHDKNGVFTGIEAKAPGKNPYANQWSRGIEILKSGGRFIIAQDDFTLDAFDNHLLPILTLDSTTEDLAFEAARLKIKQSIEVKLF